MTVKAVTGERVTRDDLPELAHAAKVYENDADEAGIRADSDHEIGWPESKGMVEARDEIAKHERGLAKALDGYASETRKFMAAIEEDAS